MVARKLYNTNDLDQGFNVVRNKQLKISIPDHIFSLHLIIINHCTPKQLENIHQKLQLKFSQWSLFPRQFLTFWRHIEPACGVLCFGDGMV